jgi:dUTP pyrophosphatase
MPAPQIAVRRLPHAEGLPLPSYATAGAAGFDLLAAVDAPMEIPSMSGSPRLATMLSACV